MREHTQVYLHDYCNMNLNKLALILSLTTTLLACNDDPENLPGPTSDSINYSIEGKWTYKDNQLNTMYIYEDGTRYTYYCTSDNCDSLYNTYEANDGNHLPSTHPYTVNGDTLIVDLHHDNELVATLTFECDGDKVQLGSANSYHLYRLGSNCP